MELLLLQNLTGQKEITTVTSLTPIYWGLAGTALAAIVAAITSLRTSTKASKTAKKVANLSKQSAQELKDKEYKNDYYKKVIDKRIKAIEAAEFLLSLFITKYGVKGSDKSYHCYLLDDLNSQKLENAVDSIGIFSVWYSRDMTVELQKTCLILFGVIAEAKELWKKEDKTEWQKYCVDNYQAITDSIGRVENAIGSDMLVLDDVPGFLKAKFQSV